MSQMHDKSGKSHSKRKPKTKWSKRPILDKWGTAIRDMREANTLPKEVK